MGDIVFSPRAYCKMLLHCAKYPHCAVNGVLLAQSSKNPKTSSIVFVDAIPLFHICLNVTPMYEVAMPQVSRLLIVLYPKLVDFRFRLKAWRTARVW